MNELTATNRAISLPVPKRRDEAVVPLPVSQAKKPAPEGGKPLPPVGNSQPVEVPKIETKAAVEQLNQYLKNSHRSLVFEMNEDLGRTIIRVVNPVTKEVIREIPPDATRVMAASLQRGSFNLLNTLV